MAGVDAHCQESRARRLLSGPFSSFFEAWLVAASGVEGEVAEEFAGGLVDDSDVEVIDDEDDGGAFEGSAEADVMHAAGASE